MLLVRFPVNGCLLTVKFGGVRSDTWIINFIMGSMALSLTLFRGQLSPILNKVNKNSTTTNNKIRSWGTWVAQSVEPLTLDFGSGHNPRDGFGIETCFSLCANSVSDYLSLSASLSCSYSLSLNKATFFSKNWDCGRLFL